MQYDYACMLVGGLLLCCFVTQFSENSKTNNGLT